MSRRSNAAARRDPPVPIHREGLGPYDLRPEELSPVERKLGTPGATKAEIDAAYEALFARARASPEGYFAVVPEGLEGDDDDP
jgi:hypothetical protein